MVDFGGAGGGPPLNPLDAEAVAAHKREQFQRRNPLGGQRPPRKPSLLKRLFRCIRGGGD